MSGVGDSFQQQVRQILQYATAFEEARNKGGQQAKATDVFLYVKDNQIYFEPKPKGFWQKAKRLIFSKGKNYDVRAVEKKLSESLKGFEAKSIYDVMQALDAGDKKEETFQCITNFFSAIKDISLYVCEHKERKITKEVALPKDDAPALEQYKTTTEKTGANRRIAAQIQVVAQLGLTALTTQNTLTKEKEALEEETIRLGQELIRIQQFPEKITAGDPFSIALKGALTQYHNKIESRLKQIRSYERGEPLTKTSLNQEISRCNACVSNATRTSMSDAADAASFQVAYLQALDEIAVEKLIEDIEAIQREFNDFCAQLETELAKTPTDITQQLGARLEARKEHLNYKPRNVCDQSLLASEKRKKLEGWKQLAQEHANIEMMLIDFKTDMLKSTSYNVEKIGLVTIPEIHAATQEKVSACVQFLQDMTDVAEKEVKLEQVQSPQPQLELTREVGRSQTQEYSQGQKFRKLKEVVQNFFKKQKKKKKKKTTQGAVEQEHGDSSTARVSSRATSLESITSPPPVVTQFQVQTAEKENKELVVNQEQLEKQTQEVITTGSEELLTEQQLQEEKANTAARIVAAPAQTQENMTTPIVTDEQQRRASAVMCALAEVDDAMEQFAARISDYLKQPKPFGAKAIATDILNYVRSIGKGIDDKLIVNELIVLNSLMEDGNAKYGIDEQKFADNFTNVIRVYKRLCKKKKVIETLRVDGYAMNQQQSVKLNFGWVLRQLISPLLSTPVEEWVVNLLIKKDKESKNDIDINKYKKENSKKCNQIIKKIKAYVNGIVCSDDVGQCRDNFNQLIDYLDKQGLILDNEKEDLTAWVPLIVCQLARPIEKMRIQQDGEAMLSSLLLICGLFKTLEDLV